MGWKMQTAQVVQIAVIIALGPCFAAADEPSNPSNPSNPTELSDLSEWPGWRGADRLGGWNAPALPDDWPGNGLPRIWQRPVGPGFSGVAVAGGRAFTQDRPKDSPNERVLCFAADDGRSLWTHAYAAEYGDLDYGKGPRATPLVADGRVYTLGAVGHVFCLDAAGGNVLWTRNVVSDFSGRLPMWGFAASPILYDGKLILHIGAEDGCFIALHPLTGELLWRGGSDPCGYATPILVRHGDQSLLVGWTPQHVVGLDPDTGEQLWKVPYEVTYGVSIASPIAHQGLVFVSGYWEGSKAIRLTNDRRRVELAWEEPRSLRGLMSQPIYREGFVYLLDRENGVVCFELGTGTTRWMDEHRITPAGRNPQASLVWAGSDGRALALNSVGELVLIRLQPDGFDELGRTSIVGETWAHPAYRGTRVWARDDEKIVCVGLIPDN
jgi:outer membrane protein assembly factor BamB